MKLSKRLICCTVLLLGVTTLAGCNKEALEIKLEDSILAAYVNEEYDFADNIIPVSGASYSLQVFYQNYYEGKEYKLECDGLKFTPTVAFDLTVIIDAVRQGEKARRTITLPVKEKGDGIDELLTTGFANWCDEGFRKTLNLNSAYIYEDTSKSSVCVSYNGNNRYTYGGSFFALHNFRCYDYYTDTIWSDTICKFYVYNPTAYDLKFQFRLKDNYLDQIDIDFGQGGNIEVVAKPGEWTECLFPFRKLGVTHTLIQDEFGREDNVNLKVYWEGAPKDEITPPYDYQFYVDGIDFVPSSYYPEIDTRAPDKMDKILATEWVDPPVKVNLNFEEEYVKDVEEGVNESSVKYEINSKEATREQISHFNNVGAANLTLVDPIIVRNYSIAGDKEAWKNAVVDFWVYNDTNYNLYFRPRVLDTDQEVNLDWGETAEVEQIALPNSWTRVLFSLRHLGIDKEIIHSDDESRRTSLVIKVKSDALSLSKFDVNWYVDRFDVVKYDPVKHPDLDTTMPVKPDHIDRLICERWCEDTFTRTFEFQEGLFVPECGMSSIKFTYNKNGYNSGDVALCLNDPTLFKEWSATSWENVNLQFYIYSPNKDIEIQTRIYAPDLEIDLDWGGEGNFSQVVTAGNWTLVSISLASLGINRALYKGTVDGIERSDELSIKTKFVGGSMRNDVFYIDGVDFVSQLG